MSEKKKRWNVVEDSYVDPEGRRSVEYRYRIEGCSAPMVSSWSFGTTSTGMRDVIEMLIKEAGYERDWLGEMELSHRAEMP